MARRVRGRSAPSPMPLVVSVGNLALGGTGKTPVVINLARELAGRGRAGAVLTRGFRSPLAGPLAVTPDNARAGDEARLLALALADIPWQVVQARNRQAGLQQIMEAASAPDVVILEDGHQTAGVGRHLDILILDHWTQVATPAGPRLAPATGHLFPFGPWREARGGAARADIWLVETADCVAPSGTSGAPVLTFTRSLALRGVNQAAGTQPDPRHPALVSGIARPERFESGVRSLVASEVPLAVRLPDHQPYNQGLVRRLERTLREADCGCLLTTAKDWIKLADLWPAAIPAYVADLSIVWGQGKTLADLVGERL